MTSNLKFSLDNKLAVGIAKVWDLEPCLQLNIILYCTVLMINGL